MRAPLNQQSFRGTLHNQTLRGFIDHDSFVDRDASAIPGSATVVAGFIGEFDENVDRPGTPV